MRKKTLAAIAAVYFVICFAYGAVSGINMPISSEEATDTAAVTTVPETQTTTSEQTEAPEEQPEIITEESTAAQTEEPRIIPEQTEPSYTETEPAYEEQQIEEYTEVTAVPSLNEYLRGLRCSGCRHNCSLANPRCMNGARKASQAESDYYSLYG